MCVNLGPDKATSPVCLNRAQPLARRPYLIRRRAARYRIVSKYPDRIGCPSNHIPTMIVSGAIRQRRLYALAGTLLLLPAEGFSILPTCHHRSTNIVRFARYGPAVDEDAGLPNDSFDPAQKEQFRELLGKVIAAKDPKHIPSLLTKNIELILGLSGTEGSRLVESILNDARQEAGDEAAEQMQEVIDIILTCAEEFVEQAVNLDNRNKNLLGRIIRTLSDKGMESYDREVALDQLLRQERDNLTPGFLRHVEGECDRIAAAPTMTPESSRLLELLRMIRARVVEELGNDLGEAAQVLGHLIGYESKSERIAILEAGLTVRGVDFAKEMLSMADEALNGFSRVPGGADPDLVLSVQEIQDRLKTFVKRESGFE